MYKRQERDEAIPEFELKEITRENLTKIMNKKMKGKKGHGMDYIDSYSLKIAYPKIENILLRLVNLSTRSGKFAKNWKSQLVLPLHKKGDKLVGTNYRPVSHISEVSKIVEYAVHEQVYEHFTSNNIFHNNHHSNLASHSTATALIQLFDLWLEAAENKTASTIN